MLLISNIGAVVGGFFVFIFLCVFVFLIYYMMAASAKITGRPHRFYGQSYEWTGEDFDEINSWFGIKTPPPSPDQKKRIAKDIQKRQGELLAAVLGVKYYDPERVEEVLPKRKKRHERYLNDYPNPHNHIFRNALFETIFYLKYFKPYEVNLIAEGAYNLLLRDQSLKSLVEKIDQLKNSKAERKKKKVLKHEFHWYKNWYIHYYIKHIYPEIKDYE